MGYAWSMLTASVIEYFGRQVDVAKALGIGRAAVWKWGEMVPPLRAAQIDRLTRGKLKFDPSQYADWYSKTKS